MASSEHVEQELPPPPTRASPRDNLLKHAWLFHQMLATTTVSQNHMCSPEKKKQFMEEALVRPRSLS